MNNLRVDQADALARIETWTGFASWLARNPDITSPIAKTQTIYIARRAGVRAATARTIAEMHFGGGAHGE